MKKVGFIGLGIMGLPMARNILKGGYPLVVYNRTPKKAEPLKTEGAEVAGSPKALAEASQVIVIMVTGPEAIDDILHKPEGLLEADLKGKIVVNMSTVSPSYTEKLNETLRERSAVFVDAPVSGSKKPAEEGTLVILASGPEERVKELEGLFLTMGKKVVYCGEVPMGSRMKLAINLLLGAMMASLSEALNFAEKMGIGRELFLDTVLAGPLGCGLFNIKKEMLLKGEYPTQFPLKHMLKDLRFALQEADSSGASVAVGHSIFQLYRQALGKGLGD
ncbi:MAG: NAD(P)-dependent oxidoreductase, partial [Nitrospirae bacterium]